MRRRDLIAAAVAVLSPVAARAQQAAMPVVGFLHSGTFGFNIKRFTPAVADGLKERGLIVGRDVAIEARAAEGHYERLPGLVAELIGRNVSAILAVGGTEPAKAAKAASSTLPVVFLSGADPVRTGLVASLARPGGNVTGVTLLGADLEAKRLQILHQLVPGAALVGVLMNPGYPAADRQRREVGAAAKASGLRIDIERAETAAEIDAGLAHLAAEKADAVLVAQDPFLAGRQQQLVALAARYKLPAIYQQREFVEIGGLASYGTNFAAAYRQAGEYVGRILQGARPADLPVVEPSTFELAINLTTAKALGLDPARTLLASADVLIE
jgi:putative ABC transport system substrate-binding protein